LNLFKLLIPLQIGARNSEAPGAGCCDLPEVSASGRSHLGLCAGGYSFPIPQKRKRFLMAPGGEADLAGGVNTLLLPLAEEDGVLCDSTFCRGPRSGEDFFAIEDAWSYCLDAT